jgi:hypothetical protein
MELNHVANAPVRNPKVAVNHRRFRKCYPKYNIQRFNAELSASVCLQGFTPSIAADQRFNAELSASVFLQGFTPSIAADQRFNAELSASVCLQGLTPSIAADQGFDRTPSDHNLPGAQIELCKWL